MPALFRELILKLLCNESNRPSALSNKPDTTKVSIPDGCERSLFNANECIEINIFSEFEVIGVRLPDRGSTLTFREMSFTQKLMGG